MEKSNLVICCAGDQSLHHRWSGAGRQFDLLLVYYGDTEGRWQDSADYYLAARGPKWHLVSHAAQVLSKEISLYDSIWIPDDDIDSDTTNVNLLLRRFDHYHLALAQPALTEGSYISHHITRRRKRSLLRYTNFVEIMAPIMRHDVFARLSEYFTLNKSGWGLDWLWASRVEREGLGGIAIIDSCAVTHTRPINPTGGFYAAMNIDPYREYARLMEEFDLSSEYRVYQTLYRAFGREFSIGAAYPLVRLLKKARAGVRSLLGGSSPA